PAASITIRPPVNIHNRDGRLPAPAVAGDFNPTSIGRQRIIKIVYTWRCGSGARDISRGRGFGWWINWSDIGHHWALRDGRRWSRHGGWHRRLLNCDHRRRVGLIISAMH